MSTPSSSKNVRFNLSSNSTPEHNSHKTKISLSNLPKRRNSKVTISSSDQVSTRYSKQRRSRPSNFLLNGRLSKEINHNRIDVYGNEESFSQIFNFEIILTRGIFVNIKQKK